MWTLHGNSRSKSQAAHLTRCKRLPLRLLALFTLVVSPLGCQSGDAVNLVTRDQLKQQIDRTEPSADWLYYGSDATYHYFEHVGPYVIYAPPDKGRKKFRILKEAITIPNELPFRGFSINDSSRARPMFSRRSPEGTDYSIDYLNEP